MFALPSLNQKRQDTVSIFTQVDPSQPWTSANNQPFAKQPIYTLECPGKPYVFDPQGWATTQYVGTAGIGSSPKFAVGPQLGAFRYDQPTPFEAITDGLSTTFLYGELAENRGTWLQGGTTTIRTLNIADDAAPAIGSKGQFGGNHVDGAFFAYCDCSVRFMTEVVDPRIIQAHMTIAGGKEDPTLGE